MKAGVLTCPGACRFNDESLKMAKTHLLIGLLTATGLLSAPMAATAAEPVPGWLAANVGEGAGQIAPVVLERARALYQRNVASGKVKNGCYFAMDATRPNEQTSSAAGGRFYMICEDRQFFRAISSGHGSGRNLPGVANFANGRTCAKNFGNAQDSELTTGGAYMTSEIKTSFKGYYRLPGNRATTLTRSFVQFDGIGETANARARAIGGHAAARLGGVCMLKKPNSPHANKDGFVPLGNLVTYPGGRSNGCTSWAPEDVPQVFSLIKDNPSTVYIYPESKDINAVAKAVKDRQSPADMGLYWNASCLKDIGAPVFWPKEKLEAMIVQYKNDHPAPSPQPLPICKDSPKD